MYRNKWIAQVRLEEVISKRKIAAAGTSQLRQQFPETEAKLEREEILSPFPAIVKTKTQNDGQPRLQVFQKQYKIILLRLFNFFCIAFRHNSSEK